MTETFFGTSRLPGLSKVVPTASWRPYAGFSYLFDNPGNSLHQDGGVLKINCDVYNDKKLYFYKALSECIEKIGGNDLINKYLLFTLPYRTYHVTVWDGINVENKDALSKKGKESFIGYLDNPLCLDKLYQTTVPHKFNEALHLKAISFRFKGLRLGGDTVLMAVLEPNTSDDIDLLKSIEEERQRLDELYYDKYEKPRNIAYTPHVALAYFSNTEMGNHTWKQASYDWVKLFEEGLQGLTLELNSVSLYGFLDMLTYFKKDK